MYWCNGCDNPFEELVECLDGEPFPPLREIGDVEAGGIYDGCPHCGDENYRDLVSQAESYREAQD